MVHSATSASAVEPAARSESDPLAFVQRRGSMNVGSESASASRVDLPKLTLTPVGLAENEASRRVYKNVGREPQQTSNR